MDKIISQRFESLEKTGAELLKHCPKMGGASAQVAPKSREDEYRSWIASVANLLQIITTNNSYYLQECDRALNDEDLRYRVPTRIMQKMYGLLRSAKTEWEQGLLRKIEYLVVAAAFDDFLDHAAEYHKGDKKIEAAILTSTVLEDSIKKIAKKNLLETSGKSLEEIIDELVKSSVFSEVKAKRVKAYAAVRNKALHAEWDKFDIKDVGGQIKGVRELIEDYL